MALGMIRRVCALAAALAAAALILGCARTSSEDRAVEKLSAEFLAAHFEAHPVEATGAGEHRYDREIDDLGQDARDAEARRLGDFLVRIKAIDRGRLSRDRRIDADILRGEIERQIFSLTELKEWERNPLRYTQLLGNSIYLLIARNFAPLDKRLDAAVARLEKFPRVVDQAMGNLANPPRIHTETAIRQNRGTIALLENDLKKEAAKSSGKAKEIEKAIGAARVALDRFQDFLERDLLARSNGDFRLGDYLYRRKLDLTLRAGMGSEQILDLARAEVERLQGQMFDLAAPLYAEMNPNKPLPTAGNEDRKAVVSAVLAAIATDHPAPEGLLDACRAAYDEAAAFVRAKNLITLPTEPLEIIWAPEFSRGVAVAGLRSQGPLDRGMKSFYVVSPLPADWSAAQVESFLREYNSEMIRILTIHEAMPGHYVQGIYANRVPSLVRAVFENGPFVEGWAVYCEQMMLDEGFRDCDPRLQLVRSKFYLRTVINAIIDAGIHREGMTEYQAMKLMIEDGFQEEAEAAGKWQRACLTSVQLSSYFVGYQELLLVRRDVEGREGRTFILRNFHERLLSHGAPPFDAVREILLEK